MYELVEHKKLDANAASITFSNIPQDGTDLLVLVSARLTYGAAVASMGLVINSPAADTSYRWLRGNGSVSLSSSDSNRNDFYYGEAPANNATSNTFGIFQIYIPNYKSSQQKNLSAEGVSEENGTTAYQYLSTGVCTKTAAVTSLTVRGFLGTSGDLVAGSSATLYKINRTSALGAPKAVGGNITYANGYWVHTFTGSGTFYANQDLSADVLIVAGGGGAGNGYNNPEAGGGGAGGLLYYGIESPKTPNGSRLSIAAKNSVNIVVGAGGAGGTNISGRGFQGSYSAFGAYSSTGGGGGAGNTTSNSYPGPTAGGSGGGQIAVAGSIGADGVSGQGNKGGNGYGSGAQYAGGGGGGAGSVGGNGTSGGVGGNGGSGLYYQITGNSVAYAGGGGANGNFGDGIGGIGGGASAGDAGLVANGTSNTGGGGAARGSGYEGGSGGSGVVIVRYKA